MREREYTLITGGAGFIGSNLADALLSDGERVVILDNLSRDGVENNVQWLRAKHGSRLRVEVGELTDAKRVQGLVRDARRVYHLAAQVAVTTSLEDPSLDLHSNLLGTFNVLEAARAIVARRRRSSSPPPTRSTGARRGARWRSDGHRLPLRRRTPGASTRRRPSTSTRPTAAPRAPPTSTSTTTRGSTACPTVVFRMSCVYGTRQFGTEDQGWVAHFARSLLGGAPITIFGDGCQVRDILWIDDLVARDAHRARPHRPHRAARSSTWAAAPTTRSRCAMVIDRLMEITGRRVPVTDGRLAPRRPADLRLGHRQGASAPSTGTPPTGWKVGLERLVEWLEAADLSTPVLPLRTPATAHAAGAGGALSGRRSRLRAHVLDDRSCG